MAYDIPPALLVHRKAETRDRVHRLPKVADLQRAYLEHAIELAEQDLRDHDGSEIDAPARLAELRAELARLA